ncbi:hypothetical protein NDU88_000451 [Pleurodeles waltl]|uniref:Uncharacterized protein n=1 Tax=Pleurodeles waltl TaxID=8319 RepID=A0AAV7UQ16_PLEWA|nr:hypothetical protein NDU88_000451 [Pleurodeles waltl]
MWLGPATRFPVRKAASGGVIYSDEAPLSPPSGKLQHLHKVGDRAGPACMHHQNTVAQQHEKPSQRSPLCPPGARSPKLSGGPPSRPPDSTEHPERADSGSPLLRAVLSCPQLRIEPGFPQVGCHTGVKAAAAAHPPRSLLCPSASPQASPPPRAVHGSSALSQHHHATSSSARRPLRSVACASPLSDAGQQDHNRRLRCVRETAVTGPAYSSQCQINWGMSRSSNSLRPPS